MPYPLPQRFFISVLFLAPALLLWTPNFTVAVIAIACLFSIAFLVHNRSNIIITRIDVAVVACLAAYFVANIPIAIIDGETMRYFKGPIRFVLCIPIYLALKIVVTNSYLYVKYLELGTIIGAYGALGIALYQFYILEMSRVNGFLYSINFGYLSCALAFLALCLSFGSEKKNALRLAFFAAVVATLLTSTRGAMFAIPILLCFIAALNWRIVGLKKIAITTLAFCLTTIGTYYLSDAFQKRIDYTITELSNITNGKVSQSLSSGGRVQLWKGASYAFSQNPLWGSTYTEREEFNKELYQKGEATSWILKVNRGHAHSQYFEMLASNGIIGLIAISVMLIFPWVYFTILYVKYSGKISLTGSVFVTGFIIYGLTESPLQANLISAFFAFMLVVFFVLANLEKNNASS